MYCFLGGHSVSLADVLFPRRKLCLSGGCSVKSVSLVSLAHDLTSWQMLGLPGGSTVSLTETKLSWQMLCLPGGSTVSLTETKLSCGCLVSLAKGQSLLRKKSLLGGWSLTLATHNSTGPFVLPRTVSTRPLAIHVWRIICLRRGRSVSLVDNRSHYRKVYLLGEWKVPGRILPDPSSFFLTNNSLSWVSQDINIYLWNDLYSWPVIKYYILVSNRNVDIFSQVQHYLINNSEPNTFLQL